MDKWRMKRGGEGRQVENKGGDTGLITLGDDWASKISKGA